VTATQMKALALKCKWRRRPYSRRTP